MAGEMMMAVEAYNPSQAMAGVSSKQPFCPGEIIIDDLEIISKILSGHPEEYAVLVRRYEVKVRGYCLSILRESPEAEDAAQEIFIKAYRALARFQGRSSFSTWLYRIAANHCKDVLRKKIRHPSESWENLLETEGEKIEKLFETSPAETDAGERADLLSKLLACLPEENRQLIVLREIQGLSYQELSEVLGCSLDAVKSRLKRTRRELEEKWRHFLKAEDV